MPEWKDRFDTPDQEEPVKTRTAYDEALRLMPWFAGVVSSGLIFGAVVVFFVVADGGQYINRTFSCVTWPAEATNAVIRAEDALRDCQDAEKRILASARSGVIGKACDCGDTTRDLNMVVDELSKCKADLVNGDCTEGRLQNAFNGIGKAMIEIGVSCSCYAPDNKRCECKLDRPVETDHDLGCIGDGVYTPPEPKESHADCVKRENKRCGNRSGSREGCAFEMEQYGRNSSQIYTVQWVPDGSVCGKGGDE